MTNSIPIAWIQRYIETLKAAEIAFSRAGSTDMAAYQRVRYESVNDMLDAFNTQPLELPSPPTHGLRPSESGRFSSADENISNTPKSVSAQSAKAQIDNMLGRKE